MMIFRTYHMSSPPHFFGLTWPIWCCFFHLEWPNDTLPVAYLRWYLARCSMDSLWFDIANNETLIHIGLAPTIRFRKSVFFAKNPIKVRWATSKTLPKILKKIQYYLWTMRTIKPYGNLENSRIIFFHTILNNPKEAYFQNVSYKYHIKN